MNKIGIFVPASQNNPVLINKIYDFLSKTPENNVFIFTDSVVLTPLPEIASVNSYLMDWSNCEIVFMNPYDYDKYKNRAAKAYYVTTKEVLPNLNKSIVENTTILIEEKTKVRKAKNAELQRL